MQQNEAYTFRLLVIVVLIVAIFATIFIKILPAKKEITPQEIQLDTRINLFYKMIYFQILLSKGLPKENQITMFQQIQIQIQTLTKHIQPTIEMEIQNYIFFQHFKKQGISNFNYEIQQKVDNPQLKNYIDFLKAIYTENLIWLKNTPYFEEFFQNPLKLPLHKIAVLDFFRLIDPQKEKEYFEKFYQETQPYQFVISVVFLSFIFSSIFGFFFLVKFFSKERPELYGILIRSYSSDKIWIFFEAAVIYLFLYISVQNFLIEFIKKHYNINLLIFQIVYTILIFFIVIVYVINEFGAKHFLHTLWSEVYFYGSSTNASNEEAQEKREDVQTNESSDQNEFFNKLEQTIKEQNLKPKSMIKEFLFGLFAFITIFPISFFILALSFLLTGKTFDLSDAHPISFLFPENFWEVIILAVIIAPITEEILFRNFIYGFFRYKFSIIISSLLSSVIFAGLHPQGAVAIPYLLFLGISLSIIREYRPSIIAPIITHMMVNAFALTTTYLFVETLNF
ncbi:MAG: CPBP family intramembrane metalloprotease [Leptospiraceae bacterium]|nr:CPBP family intramembrane metalloprotease [Leptospiraceae bacterium]MDW7976559.1 CPBP family intramembrane glutamic endopeptidase [Leptospiraceae bacterium]